MIQQVDHDIQKLSQEKENGAIKSQIMRDREESDFEDLEKNSNVSMEKEI